MAAFAVREVLHFAAMLRLPGSMDASAKKQRALDVAEMLNLTKSLDNVVGSSLMKGISGGEKRRLSLGMEMVRRPAGEGQLPNCTSATNDDLPWNGVGLHCLCMTYRL